MSIKVKIEILSQEKSEITEYLNQTENLLEDDYDEQIFTVASDLQNIKLSLKSLKKDHEFKTEEMNIKIKQLDDEIIELDANIKKRQQSISDLENRLTQYQEKNVNYPNLIQQQNTLLSNLETEKKQLSYKKTPKKKPRIEPIPTIRNWDSDSSVEGVDKSFSRRIAETMVTTKQKNIIN